MTPKTKLCALLRGVLDDAIGMVPEANRSSSLKACLAEKVLALAAQGHLDPTDPTVLTRLALRTLQESCCTCYGCELQNPFEV